MDSSRPNGFWREAFALQGSVTPHVMPNVLLIGATSVATVWFVHVVEQWTKVRVILEVAPYEIAGAALSLLLILRTNAGYDRWWEARKLWGGIVNQSRNLAISALAYGPDEAEWRRSFVAWVAAFPNVARCSLRGDLLDPRVAELVGQAGAQRVAASVHRPSCVALALAEQLREARQADRLDTFAFLQLDKERAQLIDHVGACERILKTPLPLAYSIKIRRFIGVFLLLLPFALLHRMENDWLVPPICMLVAYPLFALDQIGIELQNPFSTSNLSHLPLDEICSTIERNVTGLLREQEA